jgi:spermidine synthase
MRYYLYLTTFFAGLTSLAVEMTSSRLLERTFGMTNLVWASIIGLILIYLALGYLIGGKIADRHPSQKVFYQLLIWASVTTLLIPVISRPILQIASEAFDNLQTGALIGSFVSVMLIMVIPITLLGTASPFAIRLIARQNKDLGTTAGKLYAISTFGSFIGTFLPILLLIPTIGTYRSFIVIGGMMLIVSLVGLGLSSGWRMALLYIWTLFLIPLLLLFGFSGPDRNTPGLVYEAESAYNYIQVTERDSNTFLRLNDGQGIQSVYNPDQIGFQGPWDFVMVAPFFNPAPYAIADIKNLAIVGLAGGTTVRQINLVFGKIPIDGYELDPKIIEVARQYFGMNQSNLNVILQDGRWGLAHSKDIYSVISIDAYRPPYIPWHLTTVEFFQIVRQHLTPDGVMVINVARTPDNRDLVNSLTATIQEVFPSIYIVDVPKTWNTMIYATVQPTVKSNLAANLDYLTVSANADPLLLDTIQLALDNLRPAQPSTLIFTDDYAPVEWITNNMILEFITSGKLETW